MVALSKRAIDLEEGWGVEATREGREEVYEGLEAASDDAALCFLDGIDSIQWKLKRWFTFHNM